ncbi:ABC transporter permease subunit [Candidatus Formimonas warabiya]|uniref:ABC transporter n=1 Tax=Formimonas warabiya TaxID=1761012 RepID=A0A3G1KPK7_FORW1|nr:ABC transporter permease [Candidatus Formimonas warabiya]ATW24402.1 ABC transporter [Candidatus Formimonas warabiya]
MHSVGRMIKAAGWPRLIIAMFLLLLFAIAPAVGVREDFSLSNTIGRFGMNAILVLSLVPMIQSGCGLNFGIPVGIVAGVFGAVCSLQFELKGFLGISAAMVIGVALAIIFGYGYGKLINMVKGDEMIIATYTGLSVIAFMSLFWIKLLPVTNPVLLWGYGGSGMRQTIGVDGYWASYISNILSFKIGPYFYFPTGMLIFLALCCLLVWAFFRTKTGTAMIAVGSNPDYARAAGINVDKMRTLSVVLSTALAAVGIIVYQQSFTFIQLYQAPFNFTFPTVAAVLIGGATINKASIKNVIIGTFLFQGIVTMAPMVIGSAISDMADVVRLIISNGMILYALTRKERKI